jgi:hypothetical protein
MRMAKQIEQPGLFWGSCSRGLPKSQLACSLRLDKEPPKSVSLRDIIEADPIPLPEPFPIFTHECDASNLDVLRRPFWVKVCGHSWPVSRVNFNRDVLCPLFRPREGKGERAVWHLLSFAGWWPTANGLRRHQELRVSPRVLGANRQGISPLTVKFAFTDL